MALRNIRLEGEECLRKISRPVEKFDERLWQLLDDMADTMYHAHGVGLAGPQVGVLRRVVVVDDGNGLIELVNPVILSKKGKQVGPEGCLSLPGKSGTVERPNKVEVEASDRHGNRFRVVGVDLTARAFCHEIDHLDGVLYMDLASEIHDIEDEGDND